ncbi:hypothetical protein LTR09_010671 [Extremus antarcticus]|uniref:Uncharacterized protein n=1 Tax=Extremus antarcticus TaxID=702011 RepID=A0AAJ0DDW4_9PEZI|nr:hypothetical protein LTR09_010671 [Extremus antarcticus]
MCYREFLHYLACGHTEGGVNDYKIVRCDREQKPFSSIVPRECLEKLAPATQRNVEGECTECAIRTHNRKLGEKEQKERNLGWHS